MNNANEGWSLYRRARDEAIKLHAGQMYGDYPYAVHLNSVVAVLFKYSIFPTCKQNAEILAAAWLHDVLEDTGETLEKLSIQFGENVSSIVFCVTDDPGASREERKKNTYKKIRSNPNAIIVKLADRISNIEACILNDKFDKLCMYVTENSALTEELRPFAKSELGVRLFGHLDRLVSMSSELCIDGAAMCRIPDDN